MVGIVVDEPSPWATPQGDGLDSEPRRDSRIRRVAILGYSARAELIAGAPGAGDLVVARCGAFTAVLLQSLGSNRFEVGEVLALGSGAWGRSGRFLFRFLADLQSNDVCCDFVWEGLSVCAVEMHLVGRGDCLAAREVSRA